jgi:hypothetical protein
MQKTASAMTHPAAATWSRSGAAACLLCATLAGGACSDEPSGGGPAGASSAASGTGGDGSDPAGAGNGGTGNATSSAASGAAGGAGATGATGTGGAPNDCGDPDIWVCDGFESGAIDPALWTENTSNGATVTVDTEHVGRGTYALHAHTGGEGAVAYVTTGKPFPAPANSFYGRALVWIARAPTANFNIVSSRGPGATYNLGGVMKPWGSADGDHTFRFQYHPLDAPSISKTQYALKKWQCWEWHYQGTDPSALRFWVDGQELKDMGVDGGTDAGPWTAPQFDSVHIGFGHGHPEPAAGYDVWIDEVALGGKRLGCPP